MSIEDTLKINERVVVVVALKEMDVMVTLKEIDDQLKVDYLERKENKYKF